MRILLAEDDAALAQRLLPLLEQAGYVVEVVADGRRAEEIGQIEDLQAAIVDLGLPGLDGLSVIERWRGNGRSFPVLVLTARGRWHDKLAGFDAGADDYLTKPFQADELVLRLPEALVESVSEALVDETDVDIYWDRLARSGGREAAHAMLMQLMNPDAMGAMIPRLRGIGAPTLVVWGDRDQIVPREHAQRVCDTIPGAQLAWIEGCGHTPAEERPEALAQLIRAHLA